LTVDLQNAATNGLPPTRRAAGVLPVSLALGLWAGAAAAAPPTVSVPVSPESFASGAGNGGPFGFLAGIDRSAYLLGDMWGLRTGLSRYGISLAVQETSEVLGNVSGGSRRGADYDGLTQMVLQLDTQPAFGWHGGTFNVSALQIHGRNLSADNLATLQTASGIESDRATRLWELWYQQKFLDEDRLDVKIGQQSLDQEFIVSRNALLFVNTMFGWPMVPSADMPGGGPAYPLAALGVRARGRPGNGWTVLAGVFSGSPAPNGNPDPQLADPSGTSFPLNRGVLAIAEVQYAYPALGGMVAPGQSEALARVYKLGLWYDSEKFADLERDTAGLSLADPASTGIPRLHRGQVGLYAVVDQNVWQDPDDPDRGISVFARAMGTPQSDSNLVDFSLNAGFTLREPIRHRDDDTFGIGFGYAHVSGRAAALDRDAALFGGAFTPVRGGETFIEVTYQYEVTPWWQLQPDFQYVFNPGGGVANSSDPTRRIGDEAVLGLRAIVSF
jgi:porin